jgi:preprotein translocase SecE subunit
MKKAVNYFKESYEELKKVVWPDQKTVRNHSIVAIGFSLFVAIYFTVADYFLNLLVEAII